MSRYSSADTHVEQTECECRFRRVIKSASCLFSWVNRSRIGYLKIRRYVLWRGSWQRSAWCGGGTLHAERSNWPSLDLTVMDPGINDRLVTWFCAFINNTRTHSTSGYPYYMSSLLHNHEDFIVRSSQTRPSPILPRAIWSAVWIVVPAPFAWGRADHVFRVYVFERDGHFDTQKALTMAQMRPNSLHNLNLA